jgi:adenylate cyclase
MRTRLDRSRARGLSKFVGRDEEMERLETALRRSLAGDGQVVGVMAEAGSGKSRLCFEFLERCRAREITIRTATGVPHGRAVPLQPILEFYREVFGATDDDTEPQVRQKIAGSLAQIAPDELPSLPLLYDFMRVPDPAQPAPDLGPEERLHELIALLRRITAARSRREPAVLVFEDLHWVDPDTEKIIDALADAAAQTRTLVLLNFRPEYAVKWMGRTHYQQIALRPLDAAASALLLEDWLGSDPSLERFVELVSRSTGGNPFFMEEVVQAQIESGALLGTRGRFRLAQPIESVAVPASVKSLLAARIDRLDDTSKDLLQTAAVIGDQVAEALLERVCGHGREALVGSVRGLVQSEFLYEAVLYPESEYAFKHPLTREVAYDSLLSDRRRTLHAAVAKAIEALAGDAAEQRAALLAHHWEEAGDNLQAARWQARTATRLRMNAGESIFHWRKVTELLAEEADAPEVRALLGEARTRLVYAAGRSGASDDEVTRLFEEARRAHGGADSREHVWTFSSYAILRQGAGAISESHRLAAEGIAMARRLGDPGVLAAALGADALVHLPMDFPEEFARTRDEIDRVCAGDPSLGEELAGFRAWVVAASLAATACTHSGTGEMMDVALAEARRRLESDPEPRPMHQVLFHLAAAQIRARRGDAEGALEHGRQANDVGAKAQNLALQVLGGLARTWGLLSAARTDEAARQLDLTLPLALRQMRQTAALWCYPLLAEVELRRGDAEASQEAAARGVELARGMGFRHSEARNAIQLARALAASGDTERAAATLAGVEEVARALGTRDHLTSITEARAELAARRGDGEAAARAWREAARLHRENGEEWLATQAEAQIAP